MATLHTGFGDKLTVSSVQRENAIGSLNIVYGRKEGTSYCLVRIPRYTIDGHRIMPKVALTSGSLIGEKCSALAYARRENTVFVLNGGLFNTSTLLPQGQTVIGGVSVTNTPMTDDMGAAISNAECYPLCIDSDGNLSAPYGRNADTQQMINDGILWAVTGWGQLIDNFLPTGQDKFNEIVHPGKEIRQCIGQYENGDYLVCTVDASRNGKATHDAGMTYDTLASLLVQEGVKFAYALDGGGSTDTVVGQRQINPIYEGSTGRAVPTVIRFDVEEV